VGQLLFLEIIFPLYYYFMWADFLESSSSLRKVVQEGIPPPTTKTSTIITQHKEKYIAKI
jgi:hypothetical protein